MAKHCTYLPEEPKRTLYKPLLATQVLSNIARNLPNWCTGVMVAPCRAATCRPRICSQSLSQSCNGRPAAGRRSSIDHHTIVEMHFWADSEAGCLNHSKSKTAVSPGVNSTLLHWQQTAPFDTFAGTGCRVKRTAAVSLEMALQGFAVSSSQYFKLDISRA